MNISAPIQRRSVYCVRSMLLFSVALVIASATLRAQGTAVRVETFPLKLDGEVVVENPRGATRVQSWDARTVRIVAEKKGSAVATIEPSELVLMGAQNSVIVQCKAGVGRVDLTLYVPHGAQLQITGGTFPVDVSGTLASANIETTSGNIGYRLSSNDDARVFMSSAAGTVRSTIALAEVDRVGTHSLQGQIGNGAAQVILNSQSGNVTLAPGPASSAIARASVRRVGTPDVVQSPQQKSETGGPSDRSPSSGYENPQDQPNRGYSNRAGQPSQSGTSMVFAGGDLSNDSSSTTTSGPFVRPRTQRNTGGGDSGLKVRIIPSNSPPRGTRDAVGSIYDQANNQDDVQQNGRSSAKGSPDSGGAAPDPNSSANDSSVFAGSDRSSDGSNSSRVGPLERDRQMRNTSGGNSGLRVRIIPAPSPAGGARDSSSIFDNRDYVAPSGVQPQPPAETSRDDARLQNAPDFARPRKPVVVDDSQDEIGSTPSGRSAPPELRRNGTEESSSAPVSGETHSTAENHDEDAIVLKAALVNLNVSVTNRAGVALANLKKEEFEVAENGERQKIEFFQPTAAPFNLVLALDLSGSIKEKLDVVKSAALRFLEVVGPQDKLAVVSFTDEIRVVSQLTSDRDELKRRIKAIDKPQGGTAFYEAMWFSLADTLRGTRGQRNAIVVMTDGVDSSLDRYNPMQTRVSYVQLARRLEESDVIVFPIYLDTEYEEVFERGNSTSEAYAIARDQLDRLAEISGGRSFKAEKVGDLSGVYKQVAASLRTVYSVGYYPTNPEKDGTFRRVRVVVDRPDAAVKTRKGYYAK